MLVVNLQGSRMGCKPFEILIMFFAYDSVGGVLPEVIWSSTYHFPF
jgi:hypothetical protein